jgi:hypothetical protein
LPCHLRCRHLLTPSAKEKAPAGDFHRHADAFARVSILAVSRALPPLAIRPLMLGLHRPGMKTLKTIFAAVQQVIDIKDDFSHVLHNA